MGSSRRQGEPLLVCHHREFHFKYARVALLAGSNKAAIDSLNKYLAATGRDGEFYREALELLDEAEQTCTGKPKGTACWLELADNPGCYVWNRYLTVDETATWSAGCTGGLASGTGALTWAWGSNKGVSTGRLQDGKRTGRWVIRFGNGTVWEGPYVNDKKHGRWVWRDADGSVEIETYVNGVEQ